MEEENKSLRDQVIELNKKISLLTGEVEKPVETEKKKRINLGEIPAQVWMWNFIIAIIIFVTLWLIWDLVFAIIIAVLIFISGVVIGYSISKTWRIPFQARMMGKKKKQKGYCVFMNIGTNKAVTFIKAPVEEGVAMVNGVPHVIEPEDILLWKKKLPIIIQPQWSERPFSAKDYYAKTSEAGKTTEGWELILNYILKSQIKAKKNFSPLIWIILGIAVIGGGYYLFKGNF